MTLAYRPALATLVAEPPDGEAWLHEVKFDGYRIGCVVERGAVRLWSRRGNDWTERFSEVAEAIRDLGLRRAVIDGEVAIVLPDGRTSFQALQNSFRGERRSGLTYFAFDLLHLDGEDLARKPLEERKEALRRVLAPARRAGILRLSDHVVGGGERVFAEACRMGLEGIVSKLRAAPHRPGRTLEWRKTKCIRRQELVIGGFTDPEGSRVGIGALLVGHHGADGRLAFAGKVGTGWNQAVARALRKRLEGIARKTSPFDPPPSGRLGRNVHWVRPELVAEVAFSEWTAEGKIRHPSFQGLREDKRASEVVREDAVPAKSAPKRRKASSRVAIFPRASGSR